MSDSKQDNSNTTEETVVNAKPANLKPFKNKAITFLCRYERYNKGETAGFPVENADKYIKAGVAEIPSKAKKILAEKAE